MIINEWIIKKMNEWIENKWIKDEWINEWIKMNEWMNLWTNEGIVYLEEMTDKTCLFIKIVRFLRWKRKQAKYTSKYLQLNKWVSDC